MDWSNAKLYYKIESNAQQVYADNKESFYMKSRAKLAIAQGIIVRKWGHLE